MLALVDDSRLRRRLDEVLDALLADNESSWTLDPGGAWRRNEPGPGDQRVGAQERLMRLAVKRGRKQPKSSSL